MSAEHTEHGAPDRPRPVKCVVWDLDNTLWHGVLLEDREVTPRHGVADVVRELDRRGILQAVASRNDVEPATRRLEELGLAEYFLDLRIGWTPKSVSVERIAARFNIGLDAVLFVDDDEFERAEVRDAHPLVRTAEPGELATMLDRPDLAATGNTAEGARRRRMYQDDLRRASAEQEFAGTPEQFLASLDMRMAVRRAGDDDLERAAELTVRTNQLNATGYTYSREELAVFRTSQAHALLVAELSDRFGDYGVIGLALIELGAVWTVKLLLVSCRVMARGVGTVLLNHVIERALTAGQVLRGEFVPTDRNRPMLVAYRFAGFTPVGRNGAVTVMERDSDRLPVLPSYLRLDSEF